MKTPYSVILPLVAFSLFSVGNASASYMSKCNKLIAKWEQCKQAGKTCTTETQAIETQCKCHRLKGKQWKLIVSAVGKNNVCDKVPEDIVIPPPPPPEPPLVKDPHGR